MDRGTNLFAVMPVRIEASYIFSVGGTPYGLGINRCLASLFGKSPSIIAFTANLTRRAANTKWESHSGCAFAGHLDQKRAVTEATARMISVTVFATMAAFQTR